MQTWISRTVSSCKVVPVRQINDEDTFKGQNDQKTASHF